MTGRPTVRLRAKASAAASALCAAAALCAAGCSDIWGFHELRGVPDGGNGDLGTLPVGTDDSGAGAGGSGGDRGGVAGTGAGGSSPQGADGGRDLGDAGDVGGPSGSGGTSGEGGARGAGGSSGSGGAVAGVGGRTGTGGSVGSGGSGTGGRAGIGGTNGGTGGAGTGGRAGTGGAGGTGVCAAGANRCVGGNLQTCSATGVWQSTGTSTRQLLLNPGFEDGTTGWTTSVAGGFPLIYVATGNGGTNMPAIAAQSPRNVAWFGGYANADDVASQSVVIPADATSISVSFYYAVFTGKTGTAENDVMNVTVTSGAQTTTLAHFSNANPVTTWTRFSATLPPTLAGQTVRLQFRDLTNGNNALTSFYIDTVALQVVACPP
ncbi:MAG TPA: hypothetical protein VFH68_20105 [Polyangia bacterium]|nr:hypothetical protein [Polyangia bacterium]